MDRELEGYEIALNEAMGHWYITHRQWKGDVLHRSILPEHYANEDDANEAVVAMQNGK
jgi:hypothetical protein